MLPSSPGLPAAALLLVLLATACSPQVFRDDIGRFKTGVDQATGAFDGLRRGNQQLAIARLNDRLSRQGAKIGVVDDDACAETTFDKLQADSRCLAEWASFRAGRGAAPSCAEPARDAGGGPGFYDLAAVSAAEARACELGVVSAGAARSGSLAVVAPLANIARLNDGLRAYAAALAAIADGKDEQALQSAVGDARNALVKAANEVKALSNDSSPEFAAVGPLSDLVGEALFVALEEHRYLVLRRVVGEADPIIDRSAKIISRSAMPLLLPKLRADGTTLRKAVEAFNNNPTGDDWLAALAKAQKARDAYLTDYDASPTVALAAMADAHHALKLALDDPKREIEPLKTAIVDFATKAKAAHDVFATD